MATTSGPRGLSNRQRDTLLQIFEHPTSHNVDWIHVLSLLEAVGSVEQRHDEKYRVKVGTEMRVLTPPKHKDVPVDQLVELRHMLATAGYDVVARDLESKGKEV